MFKGTYRYRIDPKGRLPVPAAFRRSLGKPPRTLVVTPLDPCLAVYSEDAFEGLREQLEQLPAFSKRSMALMRLLGSRAADAPLDAQGRILLSPALRKAARLTQEAVVVGVLGRFEIWSPESWETFLRDSEHLLEEMATATGWSGGLPGAPV